MKTDDQIEIDLLRERIDLFANLGQLNPEDTEEFRLANERLNHLINKVFVMIESESTGVRVVSVIHGERTYIDNTSVVVSEMSLMLSELNNVIVLVEMNYSTISLKLLPNIQTGFTVQKGRFEDHYILQIFPNRDAAEAAANMRRAELLTK